MTRWKEGEQGTEREYDFHSNEHLTQALEKKTPVFGAYNSIGSEFKVH